MSRDNIAAGYAYAQTVVYLLDRYGDPSRENIMRQATSLRDATFP